MERSQTFQFSDDELDTLESALARIHGRPMDICDFSDFDWFKYVRGELNR